MNIDTRIQLFSLRFCNGRIMVLILVILNFAFTTTGCQVSDENSKLEKNWIMVQIKAPGFSPADVESKIAIPMELRFADIASVVQMESLSEPGLARIWMQIEHPPNSDDFFSQVAGKLLQLDDFPAGIQPEIRWIPDGPVLLAVIDSEINDDLPDSLTNRIALTAELVSRIKRIPHVGFVSSWSSARLDILVSVDRKQLNIRKLSLKDVTNAVEKHVSRLQYGLSEQSLQESLLHQVLVARPSGEITTLEDVAAIEVSTREDPIHNPSGPGPIVLGIHVSSTEYADDCAAELEKELEAAYEKSGLRVSRKTRDVEPVWRKMMESEQNRIFPPSYVMNLASNSKWKSHLWCTPAKIQIRMSGKEIEPLMNLSEQVRLQIRSRFQECDIITIGSKTKPAIRYEIDEQAALRHGVNVDQLRQSIPSLIAKYDNPGFQILASLADVRITQEPQLKTMADRVAAMGGHLVQDAKIPLRSVCNLKIVETPGEIWRIQSNRTVGLLISESKTLEIESDAIETILRPLEQTHRLRWPNHSIEFRQQ